jgi:hypothetical protein
MYLFHNIYYIFHILNINIFIYIYQRKNTALHFAARGGHGKIVETLVEAKADPCAQDGVSVWKETIF